MRSGSLVARRFRRKVTVAAMLACALGASAAVFTACAEGHPREGFELTEAGGGEPEVDGGDLDPDSEPPLIGIDDAGDGPVVLEAAADAACAATAIEATRERLPVDIIWVVDNSTSMQPAVNEVQKGLNAFANLIGTKGIDYRVIMLSKRGGTPTGSSYPVCIPPPLGGADCGNSANYFHASLDVKSTQPLEQLLGTLGQTDGYRMGDDRGSEPWAQMLRPNATKTIVVVTDDNSRFSATQFETFAGGKNPYNSTTLPPGLLDTSRNGEFAGYVFDAIYGWGSETDPSVKCKFANNTEPAAAGVTYTTLVQKTGGVRAKICDGSAAWGPFFDAVANAVVATSRVACEVAVPVPDGGVVDYDAVNVQVTDGTGSSALLPRVANAGACGTASGFHYDDPVKPTKVLLCPASCEAAQVKGDAGVPKIEVLLGCKTIVR